MAMHPDYPEFVRTSLAADGYWLGAPSPSGDMAQDFNHTRTTFRLAKDGEMAGQIGSVLLAFQSSGTIVPLEYGEDIPVPSQRQVVKVVEDSRDIRSKLSPVHHLINHAQRRNIRTIREQLGDPTFEMPTFEQNLEPLLNGGLVFGNPAEAVVEYSRTKLAVVKRAVYYMRFDEQSGAFAAMPSGMGDIPMLWEQGHLTTIPRTKVGEVYAKDVGATEHGRIISAELIEATGMVWQDKNKPKAPPKPDRNTIKSLLPDFGGLSPAA